MRLQGIHYERFHNIIDKIWSWTFVVRFDTYTVGLRWYHFHKWRKPRFREYGTHSHQLESGKLECIFNGPFKQPVARPIKYNAPPK